MNLLITGAWSQAKDYIEKIEKQGHQVQFMQYEKDELPCPYGWIEGVICNGLFLYHDIEKFNNLKYIQLTSAGFDRVSMNYVEEHDIEIHNARGVYSIPMAEFAMTGVLQLYKQMNFFRENQKEHVWNKHRGLFELYGKTVCILGCGSVGTECAKRFQAFGCEVVGVDLYPREEQNYERMYGLVDLDEIIPRADILILTLPLTKETKYLINEKRFSLMEEGAVLVNIARGEIVDTGAMIRNLDKLGGAVLDVFEEEPLDENSLLWDNEKVIITPHNSFVGENNQKRLGNVCLDNLNNSRYSED